MNDLAAGLKALSQMDVLTQRMQDMTLQLEQWKITTSIKTDTNGDILISFTRANQTVIKKIFAQDINSATNLEKITSDACLKAFEKLILPTMVANTLPDVKRAVVLSNRIQQGF